MRGRLRGGIDRGVEAIIFICDTMYQPNIALNFHQDIPYGYSGPHN